MRVAIWGCRDAEYLLSEIEKKQKSYEVVCIGDNNPDKQGKYIQDKEVCDMSGITEKYHSGEIDIIIIAVRKGYSRDCIIKQMKENGIDDILLLKPSALTYQLPITFDTENPLYKKQWLELNECRKPLLHHLEINIADGCNLNCKGCLHFSNLYAKDEFPHLEELLVDIKQIADNCEIFQFRVLGGEPLLNPQLGEFLERLRGILPNADLAVISNGILIPKMRDELFDIMNRNYIGFNLTLYPSTLKMKETIYDTLREHEVAYGSHESNKDRFEKFMVLTPIEGKSEAYKKCVSRGILMVREGKLYKCPIEALGKRFDEVYHTDRNNGEEVGIDIYSKKIEWDKQISLLTEEEGKLCRFCTEDAEEFQWSTGKANIEDWIVKKDIEI